MLLDRLSLATVPITTFFNQAELSQATGFVWKRGERFYLITNWHVASGAHLFTKKLLAEHGGRPNKFQCDFIVRVGDYVREPITVPVRDDDENPCWLVHPLQATRPIDIVAIPLNAEELRDRITLLPVNDLAPGKLWISVGMEVFILGYPFGASPPAFPIWKRGSIASEPDLVKLDKRYYLIDTASRSGMSGAPVILRSWSNHILESNNWVATTDKPIDRIIGVYSGRLDNDLEKAQIGMVWHVDYIEEIIDSQVTDT